MICIGNLLLRLMILLSVVLNRSMIIRVTTMILEMEFQVTIREMTLLGEILEDQHKLLILHNRRRKHLRTIHRMVEMMVSKVLMTVMARI